MKIELISSVFPILHIGVNGEIYSWEEFVKKVIGYELSPREVWVVGTDRKHVWATWRFFGDRFWLHSAAGSPVATFSIKKSSCPR